MLKIGLIGCGVSGRRTLESLISVPEASVAGVFDVRSEPAENAAKCFDVPFYSRKELIDRSDVISIHTPTTSHLSLIQEAAEKKKHIICEAPLARTLTDARKAASICVSKGVRLAPLHAAFRVGPLSQIDQLHSRGGIGTVAMARILRRRRGVPNSSGWRGNFEHSGGVILETMSHDIGFLVRLMGPVRRVNARSTRGRFPADGEFALISLGFANGGIASLQGSWHPLNVGGDELEFAYPGGLIEYSEEASRPARFRTDRAVPLDLSDDTLEELRDQLPADLEMEPETLLSDQSAAYRTAIGEIIHSLECGNPLPWTAEESLAALEVALAAVDSSENQVLVFLKEADS